MRKLAAAVLAVPVIAVIYVPVLLRRSIAARMGLALGVGAMLGLAAIGIMAPPSSTARPPTETRPVVDAKFGTDLRVKQSPHGPVTIDFSAPMDPASVATALSVDPPAPVTLGWDTGGTRLVVTPTNGWDPATYYTVTVGSSARDENGASLDGPARAAFITRPATVGRITASAAAGPKARTDTSFVLAFDRPIDLAAARAALRIEPPVAGSFAASDSDGRPTNLTFVPSAPLAPGTSYTVSLDGSVTDADGVPLASIQPLEITTVEAPAIVRFRPFNGTKDVAREADVSVRFTQPMERGSTARAFSVTVNGKSVKGKLRWAEKDTVLVFDPAIPFPVGARVALAVGKEARSRDGAVLERVKKGSFTAIKPKPTVQPRVKSKTPAPASIKPGSGSVGSGKWHAVETYYLRLMNCTRLGGWITSSGACSSPGGRNVRPLVLDTGISSRVARPYARYLATSGICSHFSRGNPGSRLRRAGYTSYRWGENIGCRSASNAFASVLGTHLFYQTEKSSRGGHWVNLMNPAYTRVGIGVWVSGGRVRLVIDFYRP